MCQRHRVRPGVGRLGKARPAGAERRERRSPRRSREPMHASRETFDAASVPHGPGHRPKLRTPRYAVVSSVSSLISSPPSCRPARSHASRRRAVPTPEHPAVRRRIHLAASAPSRNRKSIKGAARARAADTASTRSAAILGRIVRRLVRRPIGMRYRHSPRKFANQEWLYFIFCGPQGRMDRPRQRHPSTATPIPWQTPMNQE